MAAEECRTNVEGVVNVRGGVLCVNYHKEDSALCFISFSSHCHLFPLHGKQNSFFLYSDTFLSVMDKINKIK